MRLLYLTSADFRRTDAPTARAAALCRALLARGHEVRLLAPGRPPAGTELPCPAEFLWLPRVRGLGGAVVRAHLWAKTCRRRAAPLDLLLMREARWGRLGVRLARRRRVPLVVEVNGLALEEFRLRGASPRRLAAQAAAYGAVYAAAARVVALTEPIRASLIDRFALPPERVAVVPNGVELARFYPEDRVAARAALGLPAAAAAAFYVGSFHPQHGLDAVLDAWRLLGADAPLLLLGGEGGQRERLAARVQAEGLAPRVRMLGRLSAAELRGAIAAADWCLNPASGALSALTEATFPQKIFEYLACERPVVSIGENAQMRAVLVDEGCGWLVPHGPDLPARLAARVRALGADPAERRRRGARGAVLVRDRYSYEATAARLEAVLDAARAAGAAG